MALITSKQNYLRLNDTQEERQHKTPQNWDTRRFPSMSSTLFCSKEEKQKTIMVHGSKFMKPCGESKFLWLGELGDVFEYVMTKPQVVGQDITALPPELRHLELEIYSQPCFVGRAEQVTPRVFFFSRLVSSNINETPAWMVKSYLILKFESFFCCQTLPGSTSWHEMVYRRFVWNLHLKFLQGKLLQEVDARRGPTDETDTYTQSMESTDPLELIGRDCLYILF